jgi:hypothetical protein
MDYYKPLDAVLEDLLQELAARAEDETFESKLSAGGRRKSMRVALALLGTDEPEFAKRAFAYVTPKWITALEVLKDANLGDVDVDSLSSSPMLKWYDWQYLAQCSILSGDASSRNNAGEFIYTEANDPVIENLPQRENTPFIDLLRAYGAILLGKRDVGVHCESCLKRIDPTNETSKEYRERAPQAHCLEAIDEHDRQAASDAIEEYLTRIEPLLKSGDHRPIMDQVNITATALVCCARQQGLDVHVDSEYIPDAVYDEEHYPLGEEQ